ncbi:hypothetical protein TNIN_333121 [Trichonephila inaurata madagascariensis]|uniref:Uncharacterized protein n=1 Tax=Trichonephila inaurata madagascariensis TaxID=2747483 RepID=A0A8X6IK26_9ARAC|nr:hypothetical protein TNIN_333121 [Trichonephila inaurata madagascariensis]
MSAIIVVQNDSTSNELQICETKRTSVNVILFLCLIREQVVEESYLTVLEFLSSSETPTMAVHYLKFSFFRLMLMTSFLRR